MQLSEAIRLGAMLRPQCVRNYHDNGGSCALGAALEVTNQSIWKRIIEGHGFPTSTSTWLEARFPILTREAGECPAIPDGKGIPVGLQAMITHLNDDHLWTREQIADFVEQIEARHPEYCREGTLCEAEEHYAAQ